MVEQAGFGVFAENRGLPDFLFDRDVKGNRIWGPEYVVYMRGGLNKSEIDVLIDGMTLIREAELQGYQF
jgi:hypothetical protein